MPIYDYRCGTCGADFEEYAKVADYEKPSKCECGGDAPRMIGLPNTPMAGYDRPIHSNAMGINPNQVAEVQKRFPDRKYDGTGARIFRNHHERGKALKAEGFHDNDGYSGGPPR